MFAFVAIYSVSLSAVLAPIPILLGSVFGIVAIPIPLAIGIMIGGIIIAIMVSRAG